MRVIRAVHPIQPHDKIDINLGDEPLLNIHTILSPLDLPAGVGGAGGGRWFNFTRETQSSRPIAQSFFLIIAFAETA